MSLAGHVGVGVPAVVIDADEAHAGLHQPPSQQAVVGEAVLPRHGAIHVERFFGLAAEVHELRRGRLQAGRW